MSFLEDIDKGLKKMEPTAKKEAYITRRCSNCGAEITVHKVRAIYGSVRCPKCKEYLVMLRK